MNATAAYWAASSGSSQRPPETAFPLCRGRYGLPGPKLVRHTVPVLTREFELESFPSPGLLRLPDSGEDPRGCVVALHGAAIPDREQPLFTHLAETLTPLGYAVLSYDRRPAEGDGDVPLALQAQDALTAAAVLGREVDAPVGLFGFSQGSWAAARAAAMSDTVAFLAVVGCPGVSPAEQMRYFTDEALPRAGFTDADRTQALELRSAMEDLLRGCGDRDHTEQMLRNAVQRPWFDLVHLPAELPAAGEAWADMDYDPRSTFRQVHCPTLVMYGEDEETVPAEQSKEAWRQAAQLSGNTAVTIVDLPGCGHFPATPRPLDQVLSIPVREISSEYTAVLQDWFATSV